MLVIKINSTLLLFIFLTSCKAYKQDLMFKLDDDFTAKDLTLATAYAEKNYTIHTNDRLKMEVFTNNGERIVDPNFELAQGNIQSKQPYEYLVMIDGTVKFPIVGQIKMSDFTLFQAEQLLQEKFDLFYKDAYVKLQYLNKRIVMLGATGGKIIPLKNENTSLLEVIAMGGGLELGAKAQNIKVIRGKLNNPKVYVVNLSSIAGMKQSTMDIFPGDIIYIEPLRRPWKDALNDISPILSLLSSTLALAFVIYNLGK